MLHLDAQIDGKVQHVVAGIRGQEQQVLTAPISSTCQQANGDNGGGWILRKALLAQRQGG